MTLPEKIDRSDFQEFIRQILPQIDSLTPHQQTQLYQKLTTLRELERRQDAREHLLPFMQYMWPGFIQSWHHVVICNLLEEMERGDILRACISTPPRYTKSQTLSIYFPAWVLGRNPGEQTKVIQTSNTHKLAERFGRFAKNCIESPQFAEIFPKARLSRDSKASGNFTMSDGGEYFAVGVGGSIMGRGALYLLCDDVYSESDILSGNSAELFEGIEEWYMAALQRLQPNGRACVLHTRHSKADLIGRLTDRMKRNKGADQYRIISIPALNEQEESTFPNYWKTEMLKQMRTTLMEKTPHLWYAQYQQNPTSAEASIIKRSWWKKWDRRNSAGDWVTPGCRFTLAVFDTAYTAKKRSNPTACTIWGVFDPDDDEDAKEPNIILLHSFQKKMEPPELYEVAKKLVNEWQPDCVLVEAKSSGPFVLAEFQRCGIFAQGVSPKPNEDKTSRLNAIADVFASGRVWYIPTLENEDTVQQCADFPGGSGDDLVDTTAYALRRFRDGGFVTTQHDYRDPDNIPSAVIDRAYY